MAFAIKEFPLLLPTIYLQQRDAVIRAYPSPIRCLVRLPTFEAGMRVEGPAFANPYENRMKFFSLARITELALANNLFASAERAASYANRFL